LAEKLENLIITALTIAFKRGKVGISSHDHFSRDSGLQKIHRTFIQCGKQSSYAYMLKQPTVMLTTPVDNSGCVPSADDHT